MVNPDPKLLALRFNEAINARDLDALLALTTPDHLFVDSAGQRVQGRDAVAAAWRGFFQAFPDYRNVFNSLSSAGDGVVMRGHSTCSEAALAGPALWRAVVRGSEVAEWRVEEARNEPAAVTPYLLYEDVAAAISWLGRVYGFVEHSDETIRGANGQVVHSALDAGLGVVLLGCPGGDYRNPARLGGTTQNVYVYVTNLSAHFARAKAEGAEIAAEPEDTFYGDRRYASIDLEGHHWYFAEKLREIAPSAWQAGSQDSAGDE